MIDIPEKEPFALYVYTSMCGTCQVAGKMLDVIEAAGAPVSIERVNISYEEALAKQFQIESVPCLLLFKEGEISKKIYAFQSVPYIYEEMQQLAKKGENCASTS